GLIAKAFADRQLHIEPDVVSYMALRIERSAVAAHDAVAMVDAEALASKARITRSFVAQVLKSTQVNDEPTLF
ncbi:MAG: hypothetical protein ACRCT6_11555, partial [Notoacmeibacter sp.]